MAKEKDGEVFKTNHSIFILLHPCIVSRARTTLFLLHVVPPLSPQNLKKQIKTNEKSKAIKFLELLSGRRHRVSTAFNLYCKDKINSLRVVTSVVKMKRLTDNEIKSYIETNEWKGKAGAYGIQGSAEKFIQFISGSYTNIVGLPLNQVYGSLNSIGYFNEE